MGTSNINVVVNGSINEASQTYKTKILKSNIPFAQQVSSEGVQYVIKWDYDLEGETIIIPNNCILKFEGGSLNNGTINLNGCDLLPSYNSFIGNNILITGLPKEGTYKWDNELAKPVWCNGEGWVDATGEYV